jgi:uncharacterized protein
VDELDLFQPLISPSPDAEPFWAAAGRHRLEIPQCLACNRSFFYPRAICPHCGSRDIGWTEASGEGTLHSFCIQFSSGVPGLKEATPFITALVDLDDGPRLMSLLVGVDPDPERIHCGTRVRVDFHDLNDGHTLPVFRPLD